MSRARSRSRASSRRKRRASEVLAVVSPLARELAADHGLVLWDVEFSRESGRETLRVSVDREGGVGADELGQLSQDLSRELDDADAVPGDERYWLEVTSPGAERRLRTAEQFRVCRGREARVTFKGDRPPLQGVIEGSGEGWADLVAGDERVRVAFDEIVQARLVIPGVS